MEQCVICEIGNTSIVTEVIAHNGDEFTSKYRLCDHCGGKYADTEIAKENKDIFCKSNGMIGSCGDSKDKKDD